ncbi:helix-turn-helix domain-containing protein [Nocardia sp. NPDC005825]|uniref:PucR family transcriptional regulator n=1 Tax=unclassified Nocardia TaxID=2637762 RepID=UPI0033D22D23
MGNRVASIAARMAERASEISGLIEDGLECEIPELGSDIRTTELLGASVRGSVTTILHALRDGAAVGRVRVPDAVAEFTRRLARQGFPLHAMIRAYWLGQRRLNELLFAELHATDITPAARIAVMEAAAKTLFDGVDSVTRQVVVVYEQERKRWLVDQDSRRAAGVRAVLENQGRVDAAAATECLRYPLRWHHLALILWHPECSAEDTKLPRLQRFVRELAEAVGADAQPLFAVDAGTGWAWLPFRAAHLEAVAQVRKFARSRPDGPSVAIGAMAEGVAGFRRSHRSALAAHSVAVTGDSIGPKTVAATDPGLTAAALLSGRVDEAGEWVGEVLRDLATDSENDELLRETLRVFLRAGSSYKAAAAELDLHFNSVRYRVGRAVSRRGVPIGDDRIDVELALLLCHWFGSTVLRPRQA